MEIVKKSLGFKHLLAYDKLTSEESLILPFEDLGKIVFFNGIYRTWPFFFAVDMAKGESKSKKHTYYIPVNTSVMLKEQKDGYGVENDFEVKDVSCMQLIGKHYDYKDAFEKLIEHAEENNVKIGDKFYCAFLGLYDDVVTEV